MVPVIRVVSWFAGVGGFELGLRAAGGFEVVGACEIAPASRRIYTARFGEPLWLPTDIRNVRAEEIPDADLWCAGVPCQDVSVAGPRAGVRGARTGLWFDLVRLIEARRPTWLLIEEVPGLLSSTMEDDDDNAGDPNGRPVAQPAVQHDDGLGAFLGPLADCGYVGTWRVLDARFFGVPQRRRRVFILARRASAPGPDPAEVLLEREGVRGDPAESGAARARATRGASGGAEGDCWQQHGSDVGHFGALRAGHGDVQSGVPFVVGAIRHIGSGGPDDNGRIPTLQASAGRHGPTVQDACNGGLILADSRRTRSDAPCVSTRTGGRYDADSEAFVVTVCAPGGGSSHQAVLAATVRASEGHHGRSSPRGDGSDNLVVTGTGAGWWKDADEDGVRLRGQPGGTPENVVVAHANGDAPLGMTAARTVRRLLPVECERLMGWPDGHTCVHAHPQPCDCPDGPRYETIGNGVVAPVVEWIARRLREAAP